LLVGTSSGRPLVDALHAWALVRTALLFVSVGLLTIGTFRARHGHRTPTGWLIAGLSLATLGFTLSFIHVNLGADGKDASEVVSLLIETVQFALVGAGVLLLCLGVVSGRPAADGRREPSRALLDGAIQIKQFYDRTHA